MDLKRRGQVYKTYSKRFKFVMDLQHNSIEKIYLESVLNIVNYYPNDVGEH